MRPEETDSDTHGQLSAVSYEELGKLRSDGRTAVGDIDRETLRYWKNRCHVKEG